MPLRFGNLSGRHQSRARVNLSLHRLPDADRIALQGHGDLLGRTNPDDGEGAQGLTRDGGRLAQLVRASRLHREGRRFESVTAYQSSEGMCMRIFAAATV